MRRSEIRRRVERLLGAPTSAWRSVSDGHSGAERFLVQVPDGVRCFVKVGVTPWTSAAVRREATLYASASWPFAPSLTDADLDEPPIIVLEDLSEGEWPPPWTPERIARVRDLLGEISSTPAPTHLGRLADLRELLMRGWSEVAADPKLFLALGLCSPRWLEDALPSLLEAESGAADLDGDALTHLDIRSDNLCFLGSRTVAIDWAGACLAHPLTDLIKWLPSLRAEGGPPPQDILPDAPPAAVAVLAGLWAANAGRAPLPDAPKVREIQRRQLVGALPWAALTLGLPQPQPTRPDVMTVR